jgi:hypothetical protein
MPTFSHQLRRENSNTKRLVSATVSTYEEDNRSGPLIPFQYYFKNLLEYLTHWPRVSHTTFHLRPQSLGGLRCSDVSRVCLSRSCVGKKSHSLRTLLAASCELRRLTKNKCNADSHCSYFFFLSLSLAAVFGELTFK